MWELLALHIALESTPKDAAARIIIKVLHIALESTSKDTAARIIIKVLHIGLESTSKDTLCCKNHYQNSSTSEQESMRHAAFINNMGQECRILSQLFVI
jgi:hypothetical protein